MRKLTVEQHHWLFQANTILFDLIQEIGKEDYTEENEEVYEMFMDAYDIISTIIDHDLNIVSRGDKEQLIHETLQRLYN